MMSTTNPCQIRRHHVGRGSDCSVGEFGLKAEFRKDGDADMVELEIEAGRPVLVGWLHAGNMLRGEPPMCNGLAVAIGA